MILLIIKGKYILIKWWNSTWKPCPGKFCGDHHGNHCAGKLYICRCLLIISHKSGEPKWSQNCARRTKNFFSHPAPLWTSLSGGIKNLGGERNIGHISVGWWMGCIHHSPWRRSGPTWFLKPSKSIAHPSPLPTSNPSPLLPHQTLTPTLNTSTKRKRGNGCTK